MTKPGVLVISHGSREQKWVSLVDEAVHRLASRMDIPVVSSYLELVEGRLIQDGITAWKTRVSPTLWSFLYLSRPATHVDEIAYAIGRRPFRTWRRTWRRFGSGPGSFWHADGRRPEIAAMVWDKVRELSVNPAQEVILLVGHGTGMICFAPLGKGY